MEKKYRCPCCEYKTLTDGPGCFDICPVCYWEDDKIQSDNPDYAGGANSITLQNARENYKNFGAISNEYSDVVREPLDEEL